jgi:hypothetical protein
MTWAAMSKVGEWRSQERICCLEAGAKARRGVRVV